jgi:hypothetical protein
MRFLDVQTRFSRLEWAKWRMHRTWVLETGGSIGAAGYLQDMTRYAIDWEILRVGVRYVPLQGAVTPYVGASTAVHLWAAFDDDEYTAALPLDLTVRAGVLLLRQMPLRLYAEIYATKIGLIAPQASGVGILVGIQHVPFWDLIRGRKRSPMPCCSR